MQQWTRLKEDEVPFRPELRPGRRRRALPARLADPVARHGGRPSEASGGGARRAGPPAVPPPQGPAQGRSPPMSYLELRDISKVYGEGAAEVHALRRIDLSVDAGSLVAVMGASGSGKSTLLTIAGSLEDPTRGEVYVGGRAAVVAVPQRQGAPAPPVHRLRLPGLQPARRAQRGGERVPAPRARRRRGPQGPGGGARVARRFRSEGPGVELPRPAVGWRAPARRHRPGRGRATASCSWPTSPPARSTRPTPRPSCA